MSVEETDTLELEVFEMRDDEAIDEYTRTSSSSTAAAAAARGSDDHSSNVGGWRKKRKRRKIKNKRHRPLSTHIVINLPSSSSSPHVDVVEHADGECSKRDSSSSLGCGGGPNGPSNRHSTLRESLLSVLGKLVVWKGTRYRTTQMATTSSTAPSSSPPPTECIGRSTVFFSSETERRIRANNREYNSQFKYANNYIKTSKYSVLTFLPLNLFEQFQRLANFYFLCLLVLQMIPAISSLTPITTAIPLIGVLTLTAVKDAYDDFQRHSSDSQVNNRKSQTLRATNLKVEKWSQVQVGDVIRMENDQFVAADVLLLSTSEPNGLCYIETAELDG
ncbi:hypothetical protein PV325_008772 [Microctonus aethiopoides]|nr:hypothetical protein PV325_008772 [Microctonus aethiopoides]